MGRVARGLLFAAGEGFLKAKSVPLAREMALEPGDFPRIMRAAMNFSHFVRIDREDGARERHFVVHTGAPRFSIELTPDREAPDKLGRGVLKRVCVPNSWGGDYGQYAKLLAKAQDFFAESGPIGAPRRS
jgi:hypothetical protein